MTAPLSIDVRGVLPRKKDGAQSMWGKPSEIPRLIALRRAVGKELDGATFPTARLELDLHLWADPDAGDLDNFVTGICDGLMAAHSRAAINAADWADLPDSAHPERPLVFSDDSAIDRITAERMSPEADGPGYRLVIRMI